MKFGNQVRPFLQGLFVLAVVFGLYRVLRIGVDGIEKANFDGVVFTGSAFWESATAGWKFYVLLVITGLVAWRWWGSRTWKDLTGETGMHIVIWAVVGILVWSSALYPYNYYHGQAHLFDRVLIIAAGVLACRFPALLPVFTFLVYASFSQWQIALGDPEITNRKPFLDLLLVTTALLLLRGWKWATPSLAAIALLSVNLIHYWIPGLAKFRAGNTSWEWMIEDHPSNMMIASYFIGWNRLWDEEQMTALYQFLLPLEWPLKVFVLIVELVLIVSLAHRRLFFWLTAGRLLMHVGIWILSGDTFWNWIALQAAILIAFWRPAEGQKQVFGFLPMFLSAIFVILTARSHQASPLGWMDSRMVERYDVYAITVDNERRQVSPEFFAPYGFIFNQTKWHFLLPDDEKTLTRTYGAIHDPRIAKRVREAETPEEVQLIIDEEGVVERDERQHKALQVFLKRWFRNHHEKRGTLAMVLRHIAPPPHAYAVVPPDAEEYKDDGGKVKRVEIVFQRVFFDGVEYHRMAETPVLEFSVK